tara:strand:+ start:56 stop:481 length:426 start_codon:yes stop_codon:yes gene_type:complete
MKEKLFMSSQEEALTRIVEEISGIKRIALRSKMREKRIAIPRSILGYMLRDDVGISAMRVGKLVGRHHSSVLKYVKDHKDNLRFYPDYRDMYTLVQEEFVGKFRGKNVAEIQRQITSLQKQLDRLIEGESLTLINNKNQKK